MRGSPTPRRVLHNGGASLARTRLATTAASPPPATRPSWRGSSDSRQTSGTPVKGASARQRALPTWMGLSTRGTSATTVIGYVSSGVRLCLPVGPSIGTTSGPRRRSGTSSSVSLLWAWATTATGTSEHGPRGTGVTIPSASCSRRSLLRSTRGRRRSSWTLCSAPTVRSATVVSARRGTSAVATRRHGSGPPRARGGTSGRTISRASRSRRSTTSGVFGECTTSATTGSVDLSPTGSATAGAGAGVTGAGAALYSRNVLLSSYGGRSGRRSSRSVRSRLTSGHLARSVRRCVGSASGHLRSHGVASINDGGSSQWMSSVNVDFKS